METLEILIPLIVAVVTIVLPVFIQNIKTRRLNKALLTENDKLKDRSIGVVMDLKSLNEIKGLVDKIFTETKADRFLILAATNGKTELKLASALYEQHRHSPNVMLSIGAVNKYVEFEFDGHYLSLLKESETKGIVDVNVSELPMSCDIGAIYRGEGVKHSKWLFLDRKKIDAENDRVFYCSVATHENTPFSKEERIRIRGYGSHLKTIIKAL